jgi:YbgC/YbaW family acyl-CoA thioester hydrolase
MDGFNFTIPYAVRVVDINYGGHVANSAVLNYFQDARIAYLHALGGYSELDIGNQCGIILRDAHVKYLAEMFLRDQLVIGARIIDIGRLSFTMECRIERNGELVAEGETLLVCMDYQKRKPRRVEMEFREKVEAFELK